MLAKIAKMMLVAALCAVVFTGCSDNRTVLEKVKAKGKMVVYTNPEFPPYEYLGANKEIAGVEMDLVNRIAEKIGVKAEIIPAEFDSILGTVMSGKADMGASGFTINEERKLKVDFSVPFVRSVQYIIIPENSSIKTAENLAGKRIGGQNGTTGLLMIEDAVKKGILKDTKAEVKSYNNAPDAMVGMKSGHVDAVVIDELVAKALAQKNTGFKAIPLVDKNDKGLDAPEDFGIMLAKGNQDFMAIINEVIAEMKKDGSLEASFFKHFEISSKL
ncbi:MAG: transporter substrate-binding domain-containing protein [Victivallales bacterium]|nr:transporter substrate-binding domain-containing protein [Victivallales bacterium]